LTEETKLSLSATAIKWGERSLARANYPLKVESWI